MLFLFKKLLNPCWREGNVYRIGSSTGWWASISVERSDKIEECNIPTCPQTLGITTSLASLRWVISFWLSSGYFESSSAYSSDGHWRNARGNTSQFCLAWSTLSPLSTSALSPSRRCLGQVKCHRFARCSTKQAYHSRPRMWHNVLPKPPWARSLGRGTCKRDYQNNSWFRLNMLTSHLRGSCVLGTTVHRWVVSSSMEWCCGTYCLSICPCTIHSCECTYSVLWWRRIVPIVEIFGGRKGSFWTFQKASSETDSVSL